MRRHPWGAVVLALVLLSLQARAEEPTPVDFSCEEKIVPAAQSGAKGFDAYLQACIQGWLPKHIATKAREFKPSGKASITSYASMGDGATCGPDDSDEGGEVSTSFIALLPLKGDKLLSKLVLKIETTLSFCNEKDGTRLRGTITKATIIR
jgi:hypothetical protein